MPQLEQQGQGAAAPPKAPLPAWANDQDGWCRAVAADVLKNAVAPSGADIDRYVKVLLAEKRLSDDAFEHVAKTEEKQPGGNPLDAVRIDKLAIGEGINALKRGGEIEFAPGVTVIFGENG